FFPGLMAAVGERLHGNKSVTVASATAQARNLLNPRCHLRCLRPLRANRCPKPEIKSLGDANAAKAHKPAHYIPSPPLSDKPLPPSLCNRPRTGAAAGQGRGGQGPHAREAAPP